MKTTWAALIFSLSLHAFCGIAFWEGSFQDTPAKPEPIMVSLVTQRAPAREKAPELPKQKYELPKPKPPPAAPKRNKIKTVSLAEAQKAEIKNPPPRKPAVDAPSAPAAENARPKSALDFMGDPQKGKVFIDYFGKLKEKIQLNLRRKYHGAQDSLGIVTLFFVLNPDGSLVKAGIIQKDTDAGEALQKIALEALKRSAPFGSFPKDLGNGAVAFNLKVYFDELG